MNRAVKIAMLSLMIVATLGLTATPAQADHNSPLRRATECYRDAVKKFELLVIRTRYIDRYDERLVDELEDSTSRLRSAARDERRCDRTRSRFAETAALHYRVESVFFTRSVYPLNPQLEACWSIVSSAYADLEYHMQSLPGHVGHPYQKATSSDRRAQAVRTYMPGGRTLSPTAIPSYRSNLYDVPDFRVPFPIATPPVPSVTVPQPRVYTRTINVGALLQRMER